MAEKKNIKSIISNPLIQTFLIYVSGGWIVLEMTDYFINNYDLNETFRDILLIIMLAGLPVALFLSWYLSRDKTDEDDDLTAIPDKKAPSFFKDMLKRPWFSIPEIWPSLRMKSLWQCCHSPILPGILNRNGWLRDSMRH